MVGKIGVDIASRSIYRFQELFKPHLSNFIMRSALHDLLPPGLRRSLTKFGTDLARARRKRRLTVEMMAERVGVAKSTYARIEKGDPAVAMGAYAMVLFVLGFGTALGDLVDARRDEQGLLLDEERLPQRVRIKKVSP
jgi:hypothetical protein